MRRILIDRLRCVGRCGGPGCDSLPAVKPVVVRNPIARPIMWLTSAAVIVAWSLINETEEVRRCQGCGINIAAAVLIGTLPVILVFTVLAIAAWWAQTTVTEAGIVVRDLFGQHWYAWSEIDYVLGSYEEGDHAGLWRGGRRVTLQLKDGNTLVLPAPRGSRLLSNRTFQARADLIYREWWRWSGQSEHTTR